MTHTSPLKLGFVGLGINGRADGRPPDPGRPSALHQHPRQGAAGDRRQFGHDLHELARRRRAGRHHLRDGAGHARRRAGAVRRAGPRLRLEQGQARRRHEFDLARGDQDFAERIKAIGCDYLDAPVSGGEVGAKNATLSIMVGGPDMAFERARPLFELMGKNITHVGANGDGQTAKLANQVIVALTIEAVGEALLLAARAGADPAKVRQALMGGFASSKILEVHGERMIKRTFNPGFRVELHQKGPEPGAEHRPHAGRLAAEHVDRAAVVQLLRRPWRQGLGSLGDGAGAGDDGELRDRTARESGLSLRTPAAWAGTRSRSHPRRPAVPAHRRARVRRHRRAAPARRPCARLRARRAR